MIFLPRRLPLLLVLLFVAPAFANAGEPIDLLSGRNADGELAGWTSFSEKADAKTSDVWRLGDDGVLVCQGTPLGYIRTEKDFTNFKLTLQWRIPADAAPHKGGVLLRTTGKDKIWPTSLEAQINSPDAGAFWGLDGYEFQGPADRWMQLAHPQFGKLTNLKKTAAAEKPLGQWNDYTIEARGEVVTLTINGQQVNRATGCKPVAGPICLTAEGNEIHFRNIEITPLK